MTDVALQPLNTSMMTGRVVIATAALAHNLFATFIVGLTVIAVVTATLAYVRREDRLHRLAHMIAFALILSTATISFLGVVFVFLLNIYWPRFWHAIFHTMFWPFLFEAGFFLGEAVFAYAWYYLWFWGTTPEAPPWRRRVHLAFVWLAAFNAVAAMFAIDISGSYMLTPFTGVDWKNILNPTMRHLHTHRWIGNLTWTGLGLAGIGALAYLWAARRGRREDEQHYAWVSSYCFLIGFAALLLMPVSGYQYLLHVRYGQPQAFETLMLGERSWLFAWVGLLYGILVLGGTLYIREHVLTTRASHGSAAVFLPASLLVLLVAAVVLALPYQVQHIPFASRLTDLEINPLGKMQPYKYFALATLVVFGVINFGYYLRWFRWFRHPPEPPRRAWPYLLITLAVTSAVMMVSMGWARETARASNGYLIYGDYRMQDEQATYRLPSQGAARADDSINSGRGATVESQEGQ